MKLIWSATLIFLGIGGIISQSAFSLSHPYATLGLPPTASQRTAIARADWLQKGFQYSGTQTQFLWRMRSEVFQAKQRIQSFDQTDLGYQVDLDQHQNLLRLYQEFAHSGFPHRLSDSYASIRAVVDIQSPAHQNQTETTLLALIRNALPQGASVTELSSILRTNGFSFSQHGEALVETLYLFHPPGNEIEYLKLRRSVEPLLNTELRFDRLFAKNLAQHPSYYRELITAFDFDFLARLRMAAIDRKSDLIFLEVALAKVETLEDFSIAIDPRYEGRAANQLTRSTEDISSQAYRTQKDTLIRRYRCQNDLLD